MFDCAFQTVSLFAFIIICARIANIRNTPFVWMNFLLNFSTNLSSSLLKVIDNFLFPQKNYFISKWKKYVMLLWKHKAVWVRLLSSFMRFIRKNRKMLILKILNCISQKYFNAKVCNLFFFCLEYERHLINGTIYFFHFVLTRRWDFLLRLNATCTACRKDKLIAVLVKKNKKNYSLSSLVTILMTKSQISLCRNINLM